MKEELLEKKKINRKLKYIPAEFIEILRYIQYLKFEDIPDYK
jgi:hypothetical protein